MPICHKNVYNVKLYLKKKWNKKESRVKLCQLNSISHSIIQDEQTKNKLFHLWNKFYYGVRYRIELKYFLLHNLFYSILKEIMKYDWRYPERWLYQYTYPWTHLYIGHVCVYILCKCVNRHLYRVKWATNMKRKQFLYKLES